VRAEEDGARRLAESKGTENPYAIGHELGDLMTDASTVVKTAERLADARRALEGRRERYAHARLSDTGTWTNQNLAYARALGDMLALADAARPAAASVQRAMPSPPRNRPKAPDQSLPIRRASPTERIEARHARVTP
jgi:succinate dehydrogenase/fumarate reductase flavoprotein subunit